MSGMLHSQKLENHSYHMPLIRHSLLEGDSEIVTSIEVTEAASHFSYEATLTLIRPQNPNNEAKLYLGLKIYQYRSIHPSFCYLQLASYPGLLTPVFVACSTNAGKGLVKLSHVQ